MATGLTTSGGADFDSCFQTGSGNQLLYIYTNSGADIGQRYLNVSEGSAYGTTNFYASDGVDVGNKLCKAGSNYLLKTTASSRRGGYWGSGETSSYYNYATFSWPTGYITVCDESPHFKMSLNSGYSRAITQISIGGYQIFPCVVRNRTITFNLAAGKTEASDYNISPSSGALTVIWRVTSNNIGISFWDLASSSREVILN